MKRIKYKYFYNKQPFSIECVLPQYNDKKFVTFFNPYSAEIAKCYLNIYTRADYICSDGFLPILLNILCKKNKSCRISFDMTSLAPIVFNQLSKDNKSIFFVGTSPENIHAFVNIIKKEYPQLEISGYSDGYLDNEDKKMKVIETIINKNPSTILVGMGTPLQDMFACDLLDCGYRGNIYTCGGFFHQTVNSINYYPRYIDYLNLRWLYCIYKEKYILKRILSYYPKFIFNYLYYLIFTDKSHK